MNANILGNCGNFHILTTGFDSNDTGLGAPGIAHPESKVGAFRVAKHTAWSTVIRLITTGLILALMAGVAIKLKLFGGMP